MMRFATLFLIGTALSFASQAADIYRWVDENGRTQLSDTVPDKYKAKAVRVDTKQFELSPADRSAAEARLTRERAALAEPTRRRVPPRPAASPESGNASPAPPSGSDCDTLRARYAESQACFAPFYNANGSLKSGAYEVCKEVENPTLKCGSPEAY